MLSRVFWFVVPVIPALRSAVAQSNTLVCASTAKTGDWFNSNGLNPCEQYLRLRRHCEPDYALPFLNRTTTSTLSPDLCAPTSACCCNTVAFNLAMMCLSCQQGEDIDAAEGAYSAFLNGCNAPLKQSLDAAVQEQVCENGPRIPRFVYEVESQHGMWSAATVKQSALAHGNDGGRAMCKDALTTRTSTSERLDSVARAQQNQQTDEKDTGITLAAVIGAVIGTVVLCGIGFLALWWFYLRAPRSVHKRDPKGGENGDFDLLPSGRESRVTSMNSRDVARLYVNNPYIASAAQRPRPETQTFSELTLPVPLAVPSDFQQSSYSGTPFTPSFPTAPGGWRNREGAPSVIHSISSHGRAAGSSTSQAPPVPPPLVVTNTASDQPVSP